MTRTTRWYHNLGIYYNPYWFAHEIIYVRMELHRRYRHINRICSKKCIDIEIEPKTRGWITY